MLGVWSLLRVGYTALEDWDGLNCLSFSVPLFFYGGSTTVFRQTNCVCLTANFDWISMSLDWIGMKQSRQSDLLFCFPSVDCKLLLNSRTLSSRHPSFPVVPLTSLCNEGRIVNRGQIAAKRRDDEPRGIISVVKKQRATLRPTVVSP